MSMPTIEQVVSRYLFNQNSPPLDLKDEQLIRLRDELGTELTVDMDEFMTTGGGRFVGVERFRYVRKFLEGDDAFYKGASVLPPGIYAKADILGYYNINLNNQYVSVKQYYQGIYDSDYAERAYVFGSGRYLINDDALFIVNSDGTREARNICVEPDDDNFDYDGDGILADVTNYLTEDEIDPSGIGRQVPIKFIGSVSKKNYISSDWKILESLNNQAENQEKLNIANLEINREYFLLLFGGVLSRLISNEIITFEDNNRKYVIYDGKDVNNDGVINPVDYFNITEVIPYNGVSIIAGSGNDVLYGIGLSVSDELYGGAGNDTLDGINPAEIYVDYAA